MFERLDLLSPDPILGLLAAFRADACSHKVDLGVGVYKDETGRTPILKAVRAAQEGLLHEQDSKAYLGPAGNEQFNAAIAGLVLGADHPALVDSRVCTLQAPGGCGALRIGAELLRVAREDATIHVSDPTWANHVPLLAGAGLRLERYPYYSASTGSVQFDAMLDRLRELPSGDFVLLHGACHNPTGADLSAEHWHAIADVCRQRGLIPFIDLAYQGLGDGIEEDAFGARLLVRSVPEALIAVSCSKNFGLYRERVGALILVGAQRAQADAAASHVRKIVRGVYSMPPDHGAAVVARILLDTELKEMWQSELGRMRRRIAELRQSLVKGLADACAADFSAIARQRGMFSMLDLPAGAVDRLRQNYSIYMTADGRINIAGLRNENIGYVSRAIADMIAAM